LAGLLLTISISSIAIIFFAMLVTWTPHPAKLIEGVQGRYFLMPAILCTYALNCTFNDQINYKRICTISVLTLLGVYSFFITYQLLLSRYYLPN
jgi:uncharacterized membrane protein